MHFRIFMGAVQEDSGAKISAKNQDPVENLTCKGNSEGVFPRSSSHRKFKLVCDFSCKVYNYAAILVPSRLGCLITQIVFANKLPWEML